LETAAIILILGFLYFLSHFFSWVFEKSRVPDVLLLILLGLVIGPLLGYVIPADFGKVGPVMTTIALTVILFESGTSLKLSTLRSAAGPTLTLGLLTFVLTVALVTCVGFLAGLGMLQAILLGSILGGTSAAVVIPLVNALGMDENPKTILILESAITDVLCIILSFSLIKALESGNVQVGTMLSEIGLSLGVAAILGFASGLIWLQLWKVVHRFPNSTFTTIAYAFVVYGFVDSIGYSGAIGALTLGLTIANSKQFTATESPLSPTERRFYSEIVFLLKTFFFVYLGISMQFDRPLLVLVALLGIVMVYAARLGVTRLVVSKTVQRSDATLISIMIPKGLAAAVLASVPTQKGLEGGAEIQAITFAGVFISILLTALMIPALKLGKIQSFYQAFLGSFAPDAPKANSADDATAALKGNQETNALLNEGSQTDEVLVSDGAAIKATALADNPFDHASPPVKLEVPAPSDDSSNGSQER
jgi:cell volume regulation protein A